MDAPRQLSSTVAGVVTNGVTRRARSRRTRVALAIGATAALGIVLGVALFSGGPTPVATAVSASARTPPHAAIAEALPAGTTTEQVAARSIEGNAAPSIPVEALRRADAPAAAPAAPKPSTSFAAPVHPVAPAPPPVPTVAKATRSAGAEARPPQPVVTNRSSANVFRATGLALAASVCGLATPARAADAGAALDELRLGYSLKQAGKCPDALPHFARSFQLAPSPMAALNLSDCEQEVGDLVAAQGHAAQGGELARQQQNGELAAVAVKQLAALEPRLPRLSVKLTGAADCTVTRDGAALPAASIGTSLAVNPGAHVVLVTCAGRAERRFEVSVAEGERAEVAVAPGPALTTAAPTPAPPSTDVDPSSAPESRPHTSPKVLPVVVMGLGGAGLAVGLITGLAANSKHASLLEHCDPRGACPIAESDDIAAFHTLRTVSTVAYVAGAAAVLGGAVWWFLAPSPRPDGVSARVWIGPGSAGIGGRF